MVRSTLAAAACLACALAACSPGATGPKANATPAQPDYHPSFGDLMTFAVQPRHIKLGVAGHARNWAYAAYEASELRNAFKRIGKTIPTYRDQNPADLFVSVIMPSMDKLDAAIKARDGAAFDAAYGEVTANCNACHRSLGKTFVVIHEPTASSYADQDLTTPAPAAETPAAPVAGAPSSEAQPAPKAG